MRKKVLDALDRWGYYLLALLCAAAIVVSAMWTNDAEERTALDMSAAADKSERLSDVQFRGEAQAAEADTRPCAGEIARLYSGEAVYFDALGMWRTHEAIDFVCGEEQEVFALRAGRVSRAEGGEVEIDHGEGCVTLYRGVTEIVVKRDASVAAGEIIARGGKPPHGGEKIVCVSMYLDGISIDFLDRLRIEKD